MSANSKREMILTHVEEVLNDVPWVKQVKRQKLTLDQLKNFATTQLPLIGMLGGLPDPKEVKRSGRGQPDVFISSIGIDVVSYGLDNTAPDTAISTQLDDLWRILFAMDFPKACKVISTEVSPTPQTAIWPPYYAFSIKYIVTYAHDKGGV